MSEIVTIGEKTIGMGLPTYVIAELGINHNGDFDTAVKLIDQAAASGADAVKLQTYITEKRVKKDSPIFPILKQCELNFEQQKRLFDHARKINIDIFSTPFDKESVDFLASVNCQAYKVASFDLVNKTLLSEIALRSKPVIMSRGMADKKEIDEALFILNSKCVPVVLLHCVSVYPVSDMKSLNLSTINYLNKIYNCPVGYSDHTLGIEISKYAVCAGACVIEKHFTLSRLSKGPDHGMSTEPQELRNMVDSIREIEKIIGKPTLSPVPEEKDILQYRRPS